jgi:type I restriction enzyme R subunit
VLYKLRAIVLSVRSDGLIRANEEFTAWLRGERSMPFGKDGEHVTVRLVDFDDLSRNQYWSRPNTPTAPARPSGART